jgi:hypothetical protein
MKEGDSVVTAFTPAFGRVEPTHRAESHKQVSDLSIATFEPMPFAGIGATRFAVRDTANGRLGTVDLNPTAMASALVTDASTPALQPRKPAPSQ